MCELEKAIKRLVYRTRTFDEEGWKRMNVIHSSCGLDWHVNYYSLQYERVSHPNALKNQLLPAQAKLNFSSSFFETQHSSFDISLRNNHDIIVILANITFGFENIIYHAAVIYGKDDNDYKIKDSTGKKFKISKNRCTFVQV